MTIDAKRAAPKAGPDPSTERMMWKEFQGRLTTALKAMADRTFLIMATPPDDDVRGSYYVQFAQDGVDGLRAEAVSNTSRSSDAPLTLVQEQQLVALGWHEPDPARNGSPNYFQDLPAPPPYTTIARLAVRTLRDVFGIAEPLSLEYEYRSIAGERVTQPDLGVDARQGTPSAPGPDAAARLVNLADLVAEALLGWLGPGKVLRVANGTFAIWIRRPPMYVETLAGPLSLVRMSVTVAEHVHENGALLAALNDINRQTRVGRVFLVAGEVIVATELTAVDITVDQIVFGCSALDDFALHVQQGLFGQSSASMQTPNAAILH